MGFDWHAELVLGASVPYADALKFCIDAGLVDAPPQPPEPAAGASKKRARPARGPTLAASLAAPHLCEDEMESVLEERGFARVTVRVTKERDHLDASDYDYTLCVRVPPGDPRRGPTPADVAAYAASAEGRAALDEFALVYTLFVDTADAAVAPRYMALLRC